MHFNSSLIHYHLNLKEHGSALQPKWCEKLNGGVQDDELVDGVTTREKSKPTAIVIFSLMANILNVFEPQTYFEAKGISNWEQAMKSEHQSLLKKSIACK